jgi:hypothetical protein
MIDADRLLLSHYTEGVHLLDVRDPEHPRVLGHYDTHPGALRASTAPGRLHLPASNLIVVSDINGGLFVIEYTGPDGPGSRARSGPLRFAPHDLPQRGHVLALGRDRAMETCAIQRPSRIAGVR